MTLLKCCTQYISKFGNLSSGHKIRKGEFSFPKEGQCQRMFNYCTTAFVSHVWRLCSKSFKLGFSSTWTENFQMYKLSFEEAEKPEIKMPAFLRSWRKQRNARTSTSASLTMLKPLTVWITTMCGKFLLVACWKESYDKPRQSVKKNRHHFANKGPSSQSCGFSSSHGLMWELDHKNGWAPKNWYFWIVKLEKTLESSLECKIWQS